MKTNKIPQTCIGCHFLIFGSTPITQNQRNEISIGSALYENSLIGCYKGIWEIHIACDRPIATLLPDYEGDKEIKEIYNEKEILDQLRKPRENTCFFYAYSDGTSFETADELRKRELETQRLKKTMLFQKAGIWVAIGLGIANLVFNFVKCIIDTASGKPPLPPTTP